MALHKTLPHQWPIPMYECDEKTTTPKHQLSEELMGEVANIRVDVLWWLSKKVTYYIFNP